MFIGIKLRRLVLLPLFFFSMVFLIVNGCAAEPYNKGKKILNNGDFKELHNKAKKLIHSGAWSSAIPYLKEAIRINPENFDVHYALGMTYSSLKKYQNAIPSFEEAIRINPENFDAHFDLGLAYGVLKQIQKSKVQFKEAIRINPDYGEAHGHLGNSYYLEGQYENAIASYKEFIRITPDSAKGHHWLGMVYHKIGQHQKAIASEKEAILINPDHANAYKGLGILYSELGQDQKAIASYKEAIRIMPNNAFTHFHLGASYSNLGQHEKAIASYKEAIRINPDLAEPHNNLATSYYLSGHVNEAIAEYKEALRIDPSYADARRNLNFIKQKIAQARRSPPASQPRPQPSEEEPPKSGTGSGFFISKMGHIITNAHVAGDCKKITVGENVNNQVLAQLINTDRSNDLALLKISTFERTSGESKSFIKKLGVVVVPLESEGLLRSDDVKLGETILVAGYPYGKVFSNTIKVTSGIVSATRGADDDSGQFQLDAAVQPGNSGGPIYDSGGNIVGVVIAQLDKLKVAKAMGSLPENVNFGIKASTVAQFIASNGLQLKKADQIQRKPTEELAKIAQNQALMVMCLN